ncbi:MAG: DUF452 family protein [Rikenellaceae bacterium]
MKQEWLKKENSNKKLVIFFAGWSCDKEQFDGVMDFENCDIYITYDYTTIEPLEINYTTYSKITVIAWSLGVYVASTTSLPGDSITIAINGSPIPVDNKFGIPKKSFELTISSLRDHGMALFNRRISKGVDNFTPTSRQIDPLVNELTSLYATIQTNPANCKAWEYAIIAQNDLIFPPQNLLNYWNKKAIFAPILIEAPHYPFNSECMRILKEIIEIDK